MNKKKILPLYIILMVIVYLLFQSNQQTIPHYRIGVIMMGDSRYEKLTGLKMGMEKLGYNQKDIVYLVKNAKDQKSFLKEKIVQLLKEKPDLIVTLGGVETTELKKELDKQNKRIPVVFAGIASPKEIGIISDYSSPGGNFTGINNEHSSLSEKRLELLKELAPNIKRVHALYDESIPISKLGLENTQKAARAMSLQIVPWDVGKDHFYKELEDHLQERDAIFLLPGYRVEANIQGIISLSSRYQLPSMGIHEHEVLQGLLVGYGASFRDQGSQAARFVSQIIQGNSPEDLPVELPDSIRLTVNSDVMDKLSLSSNTSILPLINFVKTEEGEK